MIKTDKSTVGVVSHRKVICPLVVTSTSVVKQLLIAIFKSFASFFGIDRQFKTHDVHRNVFDRVGIVHKCDEAGR